MNKRCKLNHMELREIFCSNSNLKRSVVKQFILDNQLIPYICQICNLSNVWNSKQLILRLDHINGINDDYRLENLRFLCPNCDSQTSTYCGRNAKHKLVDRTKFCKICGSKIHRKSIYCRICQVRVLHAKQKMDKRTAD